MNDFADVIAALLFISIVLGYPLLVTCVVTRLARRRFGPLGGVVALVGTMVSWAFAPVIALAGSVPALCIAWWPRRLVLHPPPELPPARVV
jgi:hypothetical protein